MIAERSARMHLKVRDCGSTGRAGSESRGPARPARKVVCHGFAPEVDLVSTTLFMRRSRVKPVLAGDRKFPCPAANEGCPPMQDDPRDLCA